jgi:uncharacterized membrane protein
MQDAIFYVIAAVIVVVVVALLSEWSRDRRARETLKATQRRK